MTVKRKDEFGSRLRQLRLKFQTDDGKRLTLRKLAEVAQVDFSLISSVERGHRNVGELSLRKLAKALGLSAEETEEFVDEGLSAAGSKQVLDQFKKFPTHFLHVFPREVYSEIPDLNPSEIEEVVCIRSGGGVVQPDLMWRVGDKWFVAEIIIASGNSPSAANANLALKIKRKAEDGSGCAR